MPPAARPTNTKRWLLAIVLVAAALRFFPLWFGLPYPHARPDESTSIGRAAGMLGGDLNPHIFNWPSLLFYILAVVFQAAGAVKDALGFGSRLTSFEYAMIARGFVALIGTVTVAMLFRLTRRLADDTTSLLAAGYLAVAILHVRDSHFATTDVLMTMLVTASLTLLLRAVDLHARPGGGARATRSFAAAGLAAGLATSTKYSAATVVVSMAAAQVLILLAPTTRVRSVRTWMPSVIFGLAFVAGFVYGTPFAVLDYRTFVADLSFEFSHLSGGHAIDLGRGWTYHLTRSVPYGVGLGVFVAAVLGLAALTRHYTRYAFVLGAFVVAFYASMGSGQTVFFRYVLPLVPLVCLSAAVGMRHLAEWVVQRTGVPLRIVLVPLVLLTAGPALFNSLWLDLLLARTDTRVLAGEWLEERVTPGESIHDTGRDYAQLDLSGAEIHSWTFDPRANDFGDPQGRVPDWLVLHESPLTTYANPPEALRALARERYTHVWTVRATRARGHEGVYDMQDAFFLPIAGFRGVERPGPTVLIYRSKEAPALRPERAAHEDR